MTFQEADKELAEIAVGKYRSLTYDLSTFGSGRCEVECSVYVDGLGHHTAPTWREALDNLKAMIAPKPVALDATEAPINEEAATTPDTAQETT